MFRVMIRGRLVTCDSVEELDALIERFGDQVVSIDHDGVNSRWGELLRVLEAVKAAGRAGVDNRQIPPLAGLRSTRGLGPRSRYWRRMLDDHGLDLEDVLVWVRRGDGRRWTPGSKIGDAIALARKQDQV